QFHDDLAAAVLRGIAVDDLDGEGSLECHARHELRVDVAHYAGQIAHDGRGIDRWAAEHLHGSRGTRLHDTDSPHRGLVHVYHRFADSGVTGHCVLLIEIADVDAVTGLDDDLAFGRCRGRVHFLREHPAILGSLDRFEIDGWAIVHGHLHLDLVRHRGRVLIE